MDHDIPIFTPDSELPPQDGYLAHISYSTTNDEISDGCPEESIESLHLPILSLSERFGNLITDQLSKLREDETFSFPKHIQLIDDYTQTDTSADATPNSHVITVAEILLLKSVVRNLIDILTSIGNLCEVEQFGICSDSDVKAIMIKTLLEETSAKLEDLEEKVKLKVNSDGQKAIGTKDDIITALENQELCNDEATSELLGLLHQARDTGRWEGQVLFTSDLNNLLTTVREVITDIGHLHDSLENRKEATSTVHGTVSPEINSDDQTRDSDQSADDRPSDSSIEDGEVPPGDATPETTSAASPSRSLSEGTTECNPDGVKTEGLSETTQETSAHDVHEYSSDIFSVGSASETDVNKEHTCEPGIGVEGTCESVTSEDRTCEPDTGVTDTCEPNVGVAGTREHDMAGKKSESDVDVENTCEPDVGVGIACESNVSLGDREDSRPEGSGPGTDSQTADGRRSKPLLPRSSQSDACISTGRRDRLKSLLPNTDDRTSGTDRRTTHSQSNKSRAPQVAKRLAQATCAAVSVVGLIGSLVSGPSGSPILPALVEDLVRTADLNYV